MTYDVAAVRAQYPALADGRAWLDGAAGTQVPNAVIDAVAEAYRGGLANQGALFPASRRASGIVAQARCAVADLVGAQDSAGVVLGPTMTALTYRLAAALAQTWRPGDEVVLTQLDHDANLRPWAQAARRAGAVVRMAALDPATGTLPVASVTTLLSERTRLVAVTAASNVLGTLPDVPAITAAARAVGALSYVDGVHHCPHAVVDVAALGADLYVTSAYKWAGPYVAAVVAADPAVLEAVHPDRLLPAPDTVPERFELGTNPFAPLAGTVAAVEHLASLGEGAGGSRRQRLLTSRAAAVAHEQDLGRQMLAGLAGMDHVTLYGPSTGRTPTALFRLAGRTPAEIAAALDRMGVNVWHGHSYAWEALGALGLRESGGAVRAGLNHYNDAEDVQRLLTAVADLA